MKRLGVILICGFILNSNVGLATNDTLKDTIDKMVVAKEKQVQDLTIDTCQMEVNQEFLILEHFGNTEVLESSEKRGGKASVIETFKPERKHFKKWVRCGKERFK